MENVQTTTTAKTEASPQHNNINDDRAYNNWISYIFTRKPARGWWEAREVMTKSQILPLVMTIANSTPQELVAIKKQYFDKNISTYVNEHLVSKIKIVDIKYVFANGSVQSSFDDSKSPDPRTQFVINERHNSNDQVRYVQYFVWYREEEEKEK